MPGKPTAEELGIDVAAQHWRRSGAGDGTIEVATVTGAGPLGGDWVLMRVAGDPAGRVLVFDGHEWECFLDGVRNGEFDDGAAVDAVGQEGGEEEGRRVGRQASRKAGERMVAGWRSPRSACRESTSVFHNLGSDKLSATPGQRGDLR